MRIPGNARTCTHSNRTWTYRRYMITSNNLTLATTSAPALLARRVACRTRLTHDSRRLFFSVPQSPHSLHPFSNYDPSHRPPRLRHLRRASLYLTGIPRATTGVPVPVSTQLFDTCRGLATLRTKMDSDNESAMSAFSMGDSDAFSPEEVRLISSPSIDAARADAAIPQPRYDA